MIKTPDQSVIDETIARSMQLMKDSEEITNRNREMKAMLDRRLRSPLSSLSKPDIVPRSTPDMISPTHYVRQQSPSSPPLRNSLLMDLSNFSIQNQPHTQSLKAMENQDDHKAEELANQRYEALRVEALNQELQSRASKAEAEATTLREKNEDLKLQLNKANLSNDTQRLRSENLRLTSQLNNLQDFVKRYDKDLSEANEERKMLLMENEKLRLDVQQIQINLEHAQDKVKGLQKDYDQVLSQKAQDLMGERETVERLQRYILQLEQQVSNGESKYMETSKHCKDLTNLVTSLRHVQNRSTELSSRNRKSIEFSASNFELPKRPKTKLKVRKENKETKHKRSVSTKRLPRCKKCYSVNKKDIQ